MLHAAASVARRTARRRDRHYLSRRLQRTSTKLRFVEQHVSGNGCGVDQPLRPAAARDPSPGSSPGWLSGLVRQPARSSPSRRSLRSVVRWPASASVREFVVSMGSVRFEPGCQVRKDRAAPDLNGYGRTCAAGGPFAAAPTAFWVRATWRCAARRKLIGDGRSAVLCADCQFARSYRRT